jgi:hypothetical protein
MDKAQTLSVGLYQEWLMLATRFTIFTALTHILTRGRLAILEPSALTTSLTTLTTLTNIHILAIRQFRRKSTHTSHAFLDV